MPHKRNPQPTLLIILLLICAGILPAYRGSHTPTAINAAQGTSSPPPTNDNCSSADVVNISGGGYDYGTFSTPNSDLTTATGQAGEFFEFASEYAHKKSVWFEFTLPTSRSIKIKLEAAPGSFLADPKHSGVTLYAPSNCIPGSATRLGSIISSGELERYCTTPGTYRIQVTAIESLSATVFLNLTVSCPFDPIYPEVAIYDCPERAFIFNSGNPLPQASLSVTGVHAIECHSIEDASEYSCLPVANRAEFVKSTWYVFTTGSIVDLLSFDFPVGSQTEPIGYRLLEGNVRSVPFNTMPEIDCGMAEISFNTRYIELFCLAQPNTTYTLQILFRRDFQFGNFNIRAQQRGLSDTGWPMPVLPPALAANQLGVMPASLTWSDRFNCTSFISNNVCPPANPASGLVVIGAKSYDLATWATFTLATDANVEYRIAQYHSNAKYHTRIFKGTLGSGCPSPALSDIYYEFTGFGGETLCIPKGDYSIQVLASSNDTFPATTNHKDSWLNGYLGTKFVMEFEVLAHPAVGLFRLEAPDSYDDINGLLPLINDVRYFAEPAVFVCKNTVLPADVKCAEIEKAIYREVNIGDANNDGTADDGLLTMTGMRTDNFPDSAIYYQFYKGDANQLATAAGTHDEGEIINGLTDWAGFCINQNDSTFNPPGIDTFCTCVTSGTYTLTSQGNVYNVGHGDAPTFKFNMYKSIHDSRANAELMNVTVPGSTTSAPDVFSCLDNPNPQLPPCGDASKLIYREFYLSDSAVMIISEIGSAGNPISFFSGRASDLGSPLTLIAGCFGSSIFVDLCTPFPPGWYTIVSYGSGPNYTTRKVYGPLGSKGHVGETTQINISFIPPVIPNYNRPHLAYQGGVTDWADRPAGEPNYTTGMIHFFEPDTFCEPDTPFISDSLRPCGPEFNRVAFYVFELTKPSFVQIRNVDASFYTEVYPFDVDERPGDLLTVPPVYQCHQTGEYYRQICDLPPGKYTIAIMATDDHKGTWVFPSIYVDEAELSRFDHPWTAYDFDVIPATNTFVNGKTLDTHPTIPGQAPSRDVFYCTTGAEISDPTDTRCGTQINDLVYAEPFGIPKPQFLPNSPPPPLAQPWRNLWYTFKLTGSGICTLHTDILSGHNDMPLVAVYESDVDGDLPWSTVQAMLSDPGNAIIPGLTLLDENINIYCNNDGTDLIFNKDGCLKDGVRYYAVVSFDAHRIVDPPNMPNQTISVSIKYTPKPTYLAPYDERTTANVINNLIETAPPYTSVPINPGDVFTGPDFSLLCYTRNVTDPPGCAGVGKSAWFKFEVGGSGHFYTALQEIGIPNGWFASEQDMSIWHELTPGGAIEKLPTNYANFSGHEWIEGCIDPGTYYLLVRKCSNQIDTVQGYRVVLNLIDSPGDFCYNAIPVNIVDFNPTSNNTVIDCHTIGTDVGEMAPVGNTCFPIGGRKTTWFHAVVNAGPMVDLKFQLGENFTGNVTDLSNLAYRILAGTCGAMTPIACSEGNINLTLNCLGPGDYYVQVSLPLKGTSNLDVEGTLSLTVTATPANPAICTDPLDPNEVNADFEFTSDCQTITFINNSTAGFDIEYLWEFPGGFTSTDVNPVWTPPGTGTYFVTLTVTNTALNRTASVTLPVTVNAAFANYTALTDTAICNGAGIVTFDATVPGASYLWDNNSTNPTRTTSTPGTYWVIISKDGCEKKDTAIVFDVEAVRTIAHKICPDESITIEGEVFDIDNPSGTVIIPAAHPLGCDSILTVNLSFYSPAASDLTRSICEGESFDFGNQNLTLPGTYEHTFASAQGCDSVVTLTLSVTPKETFNHVTSGCIGAALPIGPTISGATYEWDNGAVTDSLTVNTPGTYLVTVTDSDGCIVSEESFNVSFGVLSSPVVADPPPACFGSEVLLTATGSSGNYQWFDAATGGNMIGTGSTLLVQNIVNDTVIYIQAFQLGLDTCISERTLVEINLSVEPVESDTRDTLICAGSSITLPWGEQVTPETNTSFSESWQYAVSGCDSLIMTVQVALEETQVDITPSDYDGFGVTCFGAEDGSVSAATFNGTPPYHYIWNTGDTTATLTNVPAGLYSVTTTSANGCVVVGSQALNEPPDIDLAASKKDLSCFGLADGSITATASGGVPDYEFSLNSGPLQQDPLFENLSAGSFNLVVIDSRGCMDSLKRDLTEPPALDLDLMAISPLCPSDTPEGSISAIATGGTLPIEFALDNGAFSGTSEFLNLSPAIYQVTAQDAAGCKVTGDVEVEPTLPISLTISSVQTLLLGDSVQLLPQIDFQPDSILWSPPERLSCYTCLEPWAKPVQTTDYHLKIWSVEGCLVSAIVRLEVDSDVDFFIPNVFSPNGDNSNDIFTVFARKDVAFVHRLLIFDRWGNGLWENENFVPNGPIGWDGNSRGQPMMAGVYVWLIEIELIDGTRKVLSGDVTLVR